MLMSHQSSHPLETIPAGALVVTIPSNARTAEEAPGLTENWAESKLTTEAPLAIARPNLMILQTMSCL